MARRHWILLLMLLGWSAQGTARVADGQLDRWLAEQATPALADRLVQHPRLAGQTLFVATAAERQGEQPDALAHAVAERLSGLLRSQPGVRLASTDSPCAVPDAVHLLVDVQATGSRQHTVDLAFLDPATGHWLGGLGEQWQGQLTKAARQQANQAAAMTPDGSAALPVAASDANNIAKVLAAQLHCTLARPHHWHGGIAPPTHGDPALLGALRRHLAAVPGMTGPGANAQWQLALAPTPDALTLTISSTGNTPMELARVWLQEPRAREAGGQQPAARPRTRTTPATAPADPDSLVSRFAVTASDSRRGVCRNMAASARCLDIHLELAHSAYALLAWSTGPAHARTLRPLACGQTPEKLQARQLRVADDGRLLGIYVLATSSRAAARDIADVLAQAPGACGGQPDEADAPGSTRHWLDRFNRTMAGLKGRVEWRLLHSAVPGTLLAEG